MHYYAIFMHSACTRVHAHMYMHTYALCGYTRHLRTCRYAAMQVNRPSGISQAAAIAVNRKLELNMHNFTNDYRLMKFLRRVINN